MKSLPELFDTYISDQFDQFELIGNDNLLNRMFFSYYGRKNGLLCEMQVEVAYDCFCTVFLSDKIWREIMGMFAYESIEIQFRLENWFRKNFKIDKNHSVIAHSFNSHYTR